MNRITLPERVAAVEQALGVVVPPDPILHGLARAAAELTHSELGFVTLLDDTKQFIVGHYGFDTEDDVVKLLLNPEGAPLEYSVCAQVITSGVAMTFPDVQNTEVLRDCLTGVAAYMGSPLFFDRQIVGAIGVAMNTGPHDWTAEERLAMDHLATDACREFKRRS